MKGLHNMQQSPCCCSHHCTCNELIIQSAMPFDVLDCFNNPGPAPTQKSKGKGVSSIRGGMSDLATSYFASMGVRTLMPQNEKKYRASMEVNMDTVMLGAAPPETSSNGKRRICYGLRAAESILLVFSVAASRLVSAERHRLLQARVS